MQKKHPNIDDQYDLESLKAISISTTVEEIRYDFTEIEVTEMKARFFELNNFQSNRTSILDQVKKALTNEWTPDDNLIDQLQNADQELTVEGYIKQLSFHNIGVAGLATLKKQIKALLKKINQGYEIRKEKLYSVSYNEYGLMAYYNEQGFFVYQRPCTASEMQSDINTTIHKLKQA